MVDSGANVPSGGICKTNHTSRQNTFVVIANIYLKARTLGLFGIHYGVKPIVSMSNVTVG